MSDGTLALSEAGLTILLQRALDGPQVANGSGSWGPFVASYNVNLNVSGGAVEIPDPTLPGGPVVRLSEVVVQGTVGGSVGLDLGAVLPAICIPPFKVCVPVDFWGDTVCLPQACVNWPTISIPIIIPVPPLGLSLDFTIPTPYQDGDVWRIDLAAKVFSLVIDLTPSIDLIIDQAEAAVHDTLGQIPAIGDLIDGLVDTVLNALKSVINAVLAAISDLIEALVRLIDVISPSVPFHAFKLPITQKILAAGGPGDREVDLVISGLLAQLTKDKELVISPTFS